MPNDWNIDIAGQHGQPGIQGIAGGTFTDAPSDGHVYGRVNATWGQAVNRAGDTMTGILQAPQFAGTGNNAFLINATYDGSAFHYIANGSAALFQTSGNQAVIYCAASGSAGATISWTGDMVVSSSGNFSNNGSLTTGNISCGLISAGSGATFGGSVQVNGSYIQCSGGIYSGNGASYLASNSQIASDNLGIHYQQWTGYNNGFSFRWGQDSPGPVGIIIDNATLFQPVAASDERLKQNIAPSTYDCLKTLLKLPLHEYAWQDHSEPGNPHYDPNAPINPIGVIAQEIHKIEPTLVTKGDHQPAKSRAERGDVLDPMLTWGIQSNNMLALLIGAVQQLTARVAELEARG
jgi:hypothetical protein